MAEVHQGTTALQAQGDLQGLEGLQVWMAQLVSLVPRGRTDKRERRELLASTESGAKVLALVEWDREDLLASLSWDLAVSNHTTFANNAALIVFKME